MKLIATIALLALSVVAHPQVTGPPAPDPTCVVADAAAAVPTCGSNCINSIGISSLGCTASDDYGCLCTQNAAFYSAGVAGCVASACTNVTESAAVAPSAAAVCACAGFPYTVSAVPTPVATPATDGHEAMPGHDH
ncbi:hypothetical protein P152DRAFT_513210 [Eremomyces bilateralis CBS 781.70]|uniref:CFEM domain-containing protein n=1 Tax=Eremomyces bilateralis CBS 781.70 TaxID=1392243 RepID=A0A6G1G739_9PEZI|nr:uncharacterized protein P152DRAFT_513210 [Eremomyces bilateralis CBS 781.70]KAF1813844.1 hypothetical protein P152DRAFT_513210 [Eremomyces bilateralis CBS 781.70]